MRHLGIVAALFPVLIRAQWFEVRNPGIPRTPAGRPDLTAAAPKMPNGKPDLSGLWRPEPNPYRLNLIQNLRDESIVKPQAETVFLKRVADFRRDDPVAHCLPGGPSDMLSGMYRIMQAPEMLGVLYEGGAGRYRQIFLDGRTLPKDPNPTWSGYSIGRWEDDTIVVESTGFNDRTWLDRAGHPHSESLRVTERFRRVDFGHVRYQITYDDPETLTKPLTVALTLDYAPDTEMLETVCNEGETDTARLHAIAEARLTLNPDILAKYSGTYTFREGSTAIAGFMGPTQTVIAVNGQLYLNALPLIPQSETRFDSTGGDAEFFLDKTGSVTHLVLTLTEGQARYDRKP
ncbi:MAG TPA: hypothetical protein VIY49_05740 [Bryobacteraceae bacterium]